MPNVSHPLIKFSSCTQAECDPRSKRLHVCSTDTLNDKRELELMLTQRESRKGMIQRLPRWKPNAAI